jgi:hypothetical protein
MAELPSESQSGKKPFNPSDFISLQKEGGSKMKGAGKLKALSSNSSTIKTEQKKTKQTNKQKPCLLL